MANEAKPGAGVIVRADFGGGVDQSLDAWRVPPSQLSVLQNGRLERVGSIRKRTGYQTVPVPRAPSAVGSPGDPVAAMAGGAQTVVIDRARTNAGNTIDTWTHLNTTPVRIGNECAYVARNHTPSVASATNGWVTTGPASDVIGDLLMLDGNAGEVDECVDYGAFESWIFVVKITRATAYQSSTTLTVSQYDATTGTLISEISNTYAGGEGSGNSARIYPKLLVYPALDRLVVAVSHRTGVGIADTDLRLYSYAATGLAFVSLSSYGSTDYFDSRIYEQVPEQRYRPVCPFDVCQAGTDSLVVAQYQTGIGIQLGRFVVSASAITNVTNTVHNPAGMTDLQALSIETVPGDLYVALVGIAVPFNSALSLPYATGNFQVPLATFQRSTLALVSSNNNPVTIATTGAIAVPGRLTLGTYQWAAADDARVCGLVEVLEYASGFVYAHRLVRVGMHLDNSKSAPDVTTFRSYAIPASRCFVLDNYPTLANSNRTPLRVGLVVGASQQTPLGRVSPSNDPFTEFAGNYSGVIGTQILTGTEEFTLNACNGPLQTYAARLQPCPPPHPVKVGGVWHVPQLVALDGGTGFGIALLRMAKRAVADAQPGTYGTLPMAPAGILQQSDGERFAEVALVDRPVIGAIIGGNPGAPNDFLEGDYLVQAVATYRDAAGNVHRSTPSDPYRFVQIAPPLASLTWTIWFSFQSYTNRNDVQIDFYVTEPNGTILRYWFSVPNVVGQSFNVAVRRDSVSATGQGLPALDAPTLYTTGGVLPFVPVPSCRFATTFKNRLIVGGADDRKSVYYSNAPAAYQAPSFAVGNVLRLEHETGCTAAGGLNDKLILFSSLGVWAIFGQFRDATGAGDAIAEPEAIHDYIGCTQPMSVVSIPTGLIFFGTDNRFYLIDERLALVPIGLKVQEITADGAAPANVVQAAVHIEAEREVRFYMQAPGSVTTTTLVYNYQVDQWATDIIAPSGSPIGSWGGACYSAQLSTLLLSTAAWWQDDGTTYNDAGLYIPLRVKTAWIQPGGSQDYSRFRYAQVLGRVAGDHDLTVRVFCDFNDNAARATGQWTAAQLAPDGVTVYPEQVRLQIGTQKTQAVKIEVYDAAPSGATTGQGPQLIGLALEMLPLGGMRRLPDTRKR